MNILSEALLIIGVVLVSVATYQFIGWYNILLVIGILAIVYGILIEA